MLKIEKILKQLKDLKHIGNEINRHNGIGKTIVEKVDKIVTLLCKNNAINVKFEKSEDKEIKEM